MAITKYSQPLEQGYIPRYAPLPLDQIGATAGYLQERQDQGLQAYTAFDVARRNSMDQVLDFQKGDVAALWDQQKEQLSQFVESGDYIDAQPVLMRAAADFQQAVTPYNQNYAAYQQAVTRANEMMQEGKLTEADYYVAIEQNLNRLKSGETDRFVAGQMVERGDWDEVAKNIAKDWMADEGITVDTQGNYRIIQTNEQVDPREVANAIHMRFMRDERFRGEMERDYRYANRNGELVTEEYKADQRARLERERAEALANPNANAEQINSAYDQVLNLLDTDVDRFNRQRFTQDYIEARVAPYAEAAGYSKRGIDIEPDEFALLNARNEYDWHKFSVAEAGRNRRAAETEAGRMARHEASGGDSMFSPLGGVPLAIQPPRVEHMASPTAARSERDRLRTQANGLIESYNESNPGRRIRRDGNNLVVESMQAGRWVTTEPTSADREQMRQVRTAVNQYHQIRRGQEDIERATLGGKTLEEYIENDPRARVYAEAGDNAYSRALSRAGYTPEYEGPVGNLRKTGRFLRTRGPGGPHGGSRQEVVQSIPPDVLRRAEAARFEALRERDPRLAEVAREYERYAQDDPYTVTPVIFAQETLNNQVEGMAQRALAERSTNGRLNASRIQAFNPQTGAPVETDRLPELSKFNYDGVFQDADGNTRFAYSANTEDGGIMVYVDASSGVEQMINSDPEAGVEWYIGRALGAARSGTGQIPTPDGDITITRRTNGQYVVRTPDGDTDTYSNRQEARRELVPYYQSLSNYYQGR